MCCVRAAGLTISIPSQIFAKAPYFANTIFAERDGVIVEDEAGTSNSASLAFSPSVPGDGTY